MAQYVKLSHFIKTEFGPGQAPTKATLMRWIDSNELPGRKIGNIYYVDMQKFSLTNNDLVNRVLLAS